VRLARTVYRGNRYDDPFVGRTKEALEFRRFVKEHRMILNDSGRDGDEGVEYARNVLVFYGVGGVGKTALSQELEKWANNERSSDVWGCIDESVDVTTRIDLHRSQGNVDPMEMVLAIRRMLGRVKKKWVAFDWILATWWASAHPGEEEFPYAVVGGNKDLMSNVMAGVSSIMVDLGVLATAGAVTVWGAKKVARSFVKQKDHRIALKSVANLEWFSDLLSRCAELPTRDNPHHELLVEAVCFLGQEMDTLPRCPFAIVFVDAMEKLQRTEDRRREGECILQELIWNLPQVLFVVTGRNRLDWGSIERTNLSHVGPGVWPGLTDSDGASDQNSLTMLSRDECQEYVHSIVMKDELILSNEVEEGLIESSGGLPQYLRLALDVARRYKVNGLGEISKETVSGSLGDLVELVLEGIPEDERRALRAATLFSRFDCKLVAVAAQVDEGCAERAMARSLVEGEANEKLFPYRMHDAIREAIRHAGVHVEGGWSESDWKSAAYRALEELKKKIQNAVVIGDDKLNIRLTSMAITLVSEEDVEASFASDTGLRQDWLIKRVLYGPTIQGLHPHIPTTSRTVYGQGFIDFINARVDQNSFECRTSVLKKLAYSHHPLGRSAFHHWAYVLRQAEKFDDAINVFDQAIEVERTQLRLYQRRLTMTMGRRYIDALKSDAEWLELSESGRKGIEAAVDFWQGLPDFRCRRYLTRAKERAQEGRIREANEFRADIIWQKEFYFSGVSELEIMSFVDDMEGAGYRYGVIGGLLALTLHNPFKAADDGIVDRLIMMSSGVPHRWATFAMVASAWARGDRKEIGRIAKSMEGFQHCHSGWIPTEMLLGYLGFDVSSPGAQWIDPIGDVQQRWVGHWLHWGERIGGSWVQG
jgi:putative ATP/GTP-binding protein